MRVQRPALNTISQNAAHFRQAQASQLKPSGNTAALPQRSQPSTDTQAEEAPYKKWRLRDFEIGKKLGRGRFGRVVLVRVKRTGFICALKTMKKEELVHDRAVAQFRREVEIQASLKHPNILEIYGYFEDRKTVYLMVEFAPEGELYKILEREGRFGPIRASRYVAEVASGLDYCHKHCVMHRDIKPENLLLGADGRIKIADFGWSVQSRRNRQTLCGTLDYLPPEMVANETHTFAVDIWALGVLTYEFLTGDPPFYTSERSSTYNRIKTVDLKFPDFFEPEAVSFIRGLLQRDPTQRLSLKDAQQHPWITKHQHEWETVF